MNWRLIKAFPKYAVVIGVLVISTGLFAAWWWWRYSFTKSDWDKRSAERKAHIAKTAASLPQKMGWLALVGPDLYDISTGELLFANWLNGVPQRLFYQPETNRLMAQTERGVIRFALDGSKDGTMGEDSPPSFTHDGRLAIYVKDGDVWIADTDWKNFRFTNQRQVTKIGQFNAPFFAANIMMGSEKAIIVRQQGKQVRINLLTGDVRPINIPLGDLVKRRSPDGRFLVGDEPKNIYAFDVEAADAYNFPTNSRDRLVDYQWLGYDRCAFIVAGKGVGLYDRTKNAVEEVCALPFQCNKMAGPSPDGRFVLCASRQGIVVVDCENKTAENFGTPAQHFDWVSADTLIYSRDVPDMSVRGTWLRPMGANERLVTGDPYAFGRDGIGAVAVMREVGIVLFATKTALFRMKPDGSELREVARLSKAAGRIQAVETWGK